MQPLIGRLFTADDDRAGAPGTMILSYRLWQTQFGGDPGVVGRQVRLDAESYTVHRRHAAGVPVPDREVLYWTPLRFNEQAYADRNDNWHYSVGRLQDGVTSSRRRRRWTSSRRGRCSNIPAENKNTGALLVPLATDGVSAAARGCCSTRSAARPPACC